MPCVYSCICNMFPTFLCIRRSIFSNSVTISHIPVSVWNNDSMHLSQYLCIQWNVCFSHSMTIFKYYCVFDGMIFSNSIFAVAATTKIFCFFIILTNVHILIYLHDITAFLTIFRMGEGTGGLKGPPTNFFHLTL